MSLFWHEAVVGFQGNELRNLLASGSTIDKQDTRATRRAMLTV
jgi:hypothetical protein